MVLRPYSRRIAGGAFAAICALFAMPDTELEAETLFVREGAPVAKIFVHKDDLFKGKVPPLPGQPVNPLPEAIADLVHSVEAMSGARLEVVELAEALSAMLQPSCLEHWQGDSEHRHRKKKRAKGFTS